MLELLFAMLPLIATLVLQQAAKRAYVGLMAMLVNKTLFCVNCLQGRTARLNLIPKPLKPFNTKAKHRKVT